MKKIIFVIIVILILLACTKKDSNSILIMCGAANKPPMQEIANLYLRKTGIKINMIFGGSGTLLSQIELSHKGDIYLPGSPDFIIKANRKKLIYPETVKIVAYLIPGIIVPKGNPAGIKTLNDLARQGVKVAIGNPATVCLGLYGIEILEKNNLLESVYKNIVTYGASCSKTANLVALSKVDAILGWRVFHFWNKNRMDYIQIKQEQIPRISYIPISIPVYAKDKTKSQRFIDFVLSDTGKAIYKKWGYVSHKEKALLFSSNDKIGGEYKLPSKYFEMIENAK